MTARAWGRTAGLLLLASCAAPPQADPFPASGPTIDGTVGWLDDEPVTYDDVARYTRTKDPESFARSLEGLLLERVTRREAAAEGVSVDDPTLDRATLRRMGEWRARVRAASKEATGEEIEPGLWLERVAGVSETTLKGWVRRHTEVELLQDRLLRLEQLRSPRAEVRLLVVEQRDPAEDLARRARAGEDFGALAREHSRHGSAGEGGALGFPLLPADVNAAAIRAALFSAKPGEVVGPFPTRGGAMSFWQVYRVEGRGEARDVGFAAAEREIVRGLEARPVAVGEYERWRRRILLRHGFVATGDFR